MKKIIKLLLFISFLFLYLNVFSREISPDNKNIYVTEAVYIFRRPFQLFYKHFSDATLKVPEGSGMFNPMKTDAVNFTVKGAQLFADALYREMAAFLLSDKIWLFQMSDKE